MRWSDDQRKHQSDRMRGARNPNYGKCPTTETREKISRAHLGNAYWAGRCHTSEAKVKMSIAKKGIKLTEDHKAKIRMSAPRGEDHKNYGRKFSLETRIKISESRLGEKNGNWCGGISYEPYCPKFNEDLKQRIRAFFDYRCLFCGKTTKENGKNLSCHHVEYNKAACCDGKPVQFAILCNRCHSRTNKDRARWEAITHFLIEEVYQNRSYFTKDEWRCMNETSHE